MGCDEGCIDVWLDSGLDGRLLGAPDVDGAPEGRELGCTEGESEGRELGGIDGALDGSPDGLIEGAWDGSHEGRVLG